MNDASGLLASSSRLNLCHIRVIRDRRQRKQVHQEYLLSGRFPPDTIPEYFELLSFMLTGAEQSWKPGQRCSQYPAIIQLNPQHGIGNTDLFNRYVHGQYVP